MLRFAAKAMEDAGQLEHFISKQQREWHSSEDALAPAAVWLRDPASFDVALTALIAVLGKFKPRGTARVHGKMALAIAENWAAELDNRLDEKPPAKALRPNDRQLLSRVAENLGDDLRGYLVKRKKK